MKKNNKGSSDLESLKKKKSVVAFKIMTHPRACLGAYAPVICIDVCLAALSLSCPWCSAGHMVLTSYLLPPHSLESLFSVSATTTDKCC